MYMIQLFWGFNSDSIWISAFGQRAISYMPCSHVALSSETAFTKRSLELRNRALTVLFCQFMSWEKKHHPLSWHFCNMKGKQRNGYELNILQYLWKCWKKLQLRIANLFRLWQWAPGRSQTWPRKSWAPTIWSLLSLVCKAWSTL